ncbi:MAG: hypothetical protein HY706_12405 [Candidatus Hydrogenedentes bacterium]|nr:hypothetical protein [Candidatus Hydrogenedentota bacterium]
MRNALGSFVGLGLALATLSCATVGDRHPARGHWARYEVAGGSAAKPAVTELVLSIPAGKTKKGEKGVWFQLEAFAGNERLYAFAVRASSLEFLRSSENAAEVTAYRYVLFPSEGEPLEYVNKRTGLAYLPPFDFWRALIPHAKTGSRDALFEEGVYLGRAIRRVETGRNAGLLPVDLARRLELDPDISIGTGRNFKEAEGRRIYTEDKPKPAGEPDYTYIPLVENDYAQLIHEVGMNRFPVAYDQLKYVVDQPVFFLLSEGLDKVPDLLYRSNFIGTVQFMDEPVWIATATHELEDAKTPQEAGTRLIERIRKTQAGAEYGGVRHLTEALKQAGYDFGDCEIRQRDIPVWETSVSGAWYELEAGMTGYVYEGRFRPKNFSKFMKETLGVDFPVDVDLCEKLHYAFFRGAARHFGAKWGVAVYGQMNLEASARAFPLAYDEGASYFWFWTSDHSHHVAFAEQKQLTRALREYAAIHPRPTPQALTAQAKVAIVLPWGYMFGDHDLHTGMLWWCPNLKLENDNGHGATYGAVLKAAMEEAVRLLRQDIRFDVLFLRENEHAEGYGEVYRVMENGQIRLE